MRDRFFFVGVLTGRFTEVDSIKITMHAKVSRIWMTSLPDIKSQSEELLALSSGRGGCLPVFL